MKLFFLFLLTSLGCISTGFSQEVAQADSLRTLEKDSTGKIFIQSINVSGNKKTKFYIVLREIQFKSGDSITLKKFTTDLKQSRNLVYNTTLFTEVTFTYEYLSARAVRVNVAVKEKWYIFPTPQFQLIDRNFNEWIKVYKADLNRVVYGAKFVHYNLSGRRDQLRINLLNGYGRNFSIGYTNPYSNRALSEGFGVSAGFSQSREISYATSPQNKLLFFKKNNEFVRSNFAISASYIARKGYFRRHLFALSYNNLSVPDSVTAFYNPNYFNVPGRRKGFTDAGYYFQYVNTNNVNYPLTGSLFNVNVVKRGLGFTGGVNMLTIEGGYSKFLAHGHNFYSTLQFNGVVKAPFNQPYINQRALGYGLYLRGLEYYVVDGVAAAVSKYTLRKKLLSFNIPVPFKIRTIPKIPITIFAKAYGDAGFSYNKQPYVSMLNNKMLYSSGFGIDILTLYDINLQLEYSFNQLGENGLFLHARGGF